MLILAGTTGSAQIFKKLGDKIKGEVEWRAQRKAGQKIDQGLDSLLAIPKKVTDKKAAKEPKNASPDQQQKNKNNNSAVAKQANSKKEPNTTIKAVPVQQKEAELGTVDGHVTLKLSADKIFTGGSILISGESVLYKNFKQVEITVTGPSGTDVKNITLSTGGKYFSQWNANEKTGEYTVTVVSSDKKAKETATFEVEELELIFDDDWPEKNIKETQKALDNLEEAADRVKGGISPKNKAELDKKMADVKDKVKDVLQLYKGLGKANLEMAKLVKKENKLPRNLADNLSELNNILAEQADQMKRINEMVDHKPPDNSICEYLVMLNEACAAFSTFTNGVAKGLGGVIKNIMLDKAVPKVTGAINEAAGGPSEPFDFPLKEASKIYATSKFDAQSLTEKLGKAGIAGDVVQFATDVLMKIYCEVFTGSFTHDYTIEFRNSGGVTWWSYGVEMKAALKLRYPKKNISSTVIKMKGNLEGNATKFSFFEDIDKEDGFQEGSKGKIEVVGLKVFMPLGVSFATSERDILGFGAIARGLATPAYFNIQVDAEYDVDADKIKLFVNEPLVDFMPWVANQFVFVMFGGDLIPWIKKMTFPIHKAKRTISSVLYKNNEFTVDKDANGNLSFKGKANKHMGGPAEKMEHDLNFTISAKKE